MLLFDLNKFIKNKRFNPLLWVLFHTISVKINDLSSSNITKIIENVILPICLNHMCEICKHHSSIYFEKNNYWKDVKSKKDLIRKLYDFHNEVNERLEKTNKFDFENIEKYKELKMNVIINGLKITIKKKKLDNEEYIFSQINNIQTFLEENNDMFENYE
jgi:hypothetical protein